ncbi:hypothetical protein LEMA_P055090.1 [Plenodomus lingam JN3]|uniref:superoxide dismutase n=2 Tax=Leptosphaeria maculans TaxID=5022 RepID=E4ZLX3_LEPMJ|nr:hypothetical protein LEMA_P055090.1 [Plenodomus lingam JN3]CBX92803.1 hypothetical protein LEMA_P055090.1 [Plenodomus lingam JN3]
MAAAATAQSSAVQPAPVITDSTPGAHFVGVLPHKANSNLSGSISAVSAPDGKGVRFTVSFAGLPAEGGPFMYHIHAKPVPTDGNCTGTAAHLDPYLRGEVPICDATKPETCQTGDLSGKFGNMTEQSWSQEYIDPYSSLNKADPSYFGNLSFVVHLHNKTRIGCANFTDMSPGSDHPSGGISSGSLPKPTEMPTYNTSGSPSASATGGSPVPPTPTSSTPPAQFTNAAASVVGGSAALLVAAIALVL